MGNRGEPGGGLGGVAGIIDRCRLGTLPYLPSIEISCRQFDISGCNRHNALDHPSLSHRFDSMPSVDVRATLPHANRCGE